MGANFIQKATTIRKDTRIAGKWLWSLLLNCTRTLKLDVVGSRYRAMLWSTVLISFSCLFLPRWERRDPTNS